jgi:hypothetical protein
MRRFLTNVVVGFGGRDTRLAGSRYGAEKQKAARQLAVRARSSLLVTACV